MSANQVTTGSGSPIPASNRVFGSLLQLPPQATEKKPEMGQKKVTPPGGHQMQGEKAATPRGDSLQQMQKMLQRQYC